MAILRYHRAHHNRQKRHHSKEKTDIVREGHMVDALALSADEGRGHAAKSLGEVLATSDPRESEWGNPTWRQVTDPLDGRREPGELKHLTYPEEKRGFP